MGQLILDNLQWFLVAVGVVSIIPFIVGFVKGFRKLSWGCVIWGLCAVAFYFAHKFVVEPQIQGFYNNGETDIGALNVLSYWLNVAAAGAAIVAVMAVVGVIALIFRPHQKKTLSAYRQAKVDEKERKKCLDLDEDEILKRLDRKGKPCFLNRLVGGIVAVVNFLVVLIAILAVAIVIAYATPLQSEIHYIIYNSHVMHVIAEYVQTYTWDLLIIGFAVAMAYVGYRKGFICAFYTILSKVGYFVIVVASFVIPFTPIAIEGPFKFLSGLANIIAGFMAGTILEGISATLGLIVVGILLCIILCVVWKLLIMAYKAIANMLLRCKFFVFIDSVNGALVNLCFSLFIVTLFVSVFYVFDYCGFIALENYVVPWSPLLGGMIHMIDATLRPLLETLSASSFF